MQILKGIHNKSKKYIKAKFSDLYSNPIILIQTLGKIVPNKGSSTPGINSKTLNKINLKKMATAKFNF